MIERRVWPAGVSEYSTTVTRPVSVAWVDFFRVDGKIAA